MLKIVWNNFSTVYPSLLLLLFPASYLVYQSIVALCLYKAGALSSPE